MKIAKKFDRIHNINVIFTYKVLKIKLNRRNSMKKILVTGGTTFVSRYVAKYFVKCGYEVYVLNRNTKPQVEGVRLIEGDRKNLGSILKDFHFDVVADITAYTQSDILNLLDGLGAFEQYIMISSSAVYPEYEAQPFNENAKLAENKFWGAYGTNKIEAEKALLQKVPNAYILRPPYLYGPMNNVYREAFVFDCAIGDRKFYLPKDGKMKMQFFHVADLCKLMNIIIDTKPDTHIMNVGNPTSVTIKEWVSMCYKVAGKIPEYINVYKDIDQRNYFSFYDYEYELDVSKQNKLLPQVKELEEGLKECYEWYIKNQNEVRKKPLTDFIDGNLI